MDKWQKLKDFLIDGKEHITKDFYVSRPSVFEEILDIMEELEKREVSEIKKIQEEMRDKHYKVEKGTNDGDLRFAWQLTCNGKHLQWFSDEVIARRTCDELNARELLKGEQK